MPTEANGDLRPVSTTTGGRATTASHAASPSLTDADQHERRVQSDQLGQPGADDRTEQETAELRAGEGAQPPAGVERVPGR